MREGQFDPSRFVQTFLETHRNFSGKNEEIAEASICDLEILKANFQNISVEHELSPQLGGGGGIENSVHNIRGPRKREPSTVVALLVVHSFIRFLVFEKC